MSRTNPLALSAIASLLIAGGAVAQDYRYAVFELPGLTELYQGDAPGGIDSFGNVVGGSDLGPFQPRPTLWPSSGGVIDLGTRGGDYAAAASINVNGEIAGGAVFDPNGNFFDTRASLWRAGELIDLGTLGGEASWATDLNDSTQVVGESEYTGGSGGKGFLWENGEMRELDDPWPDRNATDVWGINDIGEIVGKGLNLDAIQRAMLWIDEEPIDLGSLSGGASVAYAINNSSVIVGSSETISGDRHAVKWVNRQIVDIHTPSAGERSVAWYINDVGQILGENNHTEVAMILNPGEDWIILNDVVPPLLRKDWNITHAREINDAGQIPVTANIGFDLWALLLTPVHPTMTLEGPQPGRAGTTNGLRVTGVTPGARVTFLYSRHGGGTRIPGCDLQQNALQLDNPTVIGTAIANQQGVATITRPVPLIARGQTILFQAVVQNECAISQLVVWRFE